MVDESILAAIRSKHKLSREATPEEAPFEQALWQSSQIVDQPQGIEGEIARIIRPHAPWTGRPPFSLAEMMVMACVSGNGKPKTDNEISDWMVTNFRYYQNLAMAAFHAHTSRHVVRKLEYGAQDVSASTRESVILRLDNPILRVTGNKLFVPIHEGRVFLRKFLVPESDGTFRFLDLPPEIRIMIYELLWAFPPSGLSLTGVAHPKHPDKGRRRPDRGLFALRIEQDQGSPADWLAPANNEMHSERYHTLPARDLLAMLRVNKQISKEALPYFYRGNHFHCDGVHNLQRLLRHCGAEARKHFTSISFKWAQGVELTDRTFKLLQEVRKLTHLYIGASDPDGDVMRMPGINVLREVKCGSVKFYGNCPLLKANLQGDMQKPKVDDDEHKAEPVKKRKRAPKKAETASRDTKPTKKKKKKVAKKPCEGSPPQDW